MELTVLGNLQDVADEGTVAIESFGPGQVDGSLLGRAEPGRGVLRGVGQLPAGGTHTHTTFRWINESRTSLV